MPAQKQPLPDMNPDLNEQNRGGGEEVTREKSYSPSHQNGDSCNNAQSRHLSPSLSQSPHPQASHERSRGGEDDIKEEEEVEVEEEGVEEEENGDEKEADDDDEEFEKEDKQEGSNKSESSSSEDEIPEFVLVDIREIRKDVQCPICLGIIKKTRTVMECLHRFCRECIDKSMRMGNNECPACRTHCASRRSLRDDPNFDALIAALYPDIDKYEEEELAFQEEERARNKQIQASIAQVMQRQSEALVKRRTIGKETSAFTTRAQPDSRTRPSKRRRISRGNDFQGSEGNEEGKNDNGVKDSSSADEHSTELRPRKRKRQSGSRSLQPSSSGTNENDSEISRENRGMLVWNKEMFAWGRGGTRSHTRHGNASNGNNKNSRSTRISKLVDHLRSLDKKNDGSDVHLKLFSLDIERSPSLQRPYLCCKPSLSIKHLSQHIAQQTQLQNEEIEIMLVKDGGKHGNNLSTRHPPVPLDGLQLLKEEETLAGLITRCISSRDGLILAYQRKKTNS